MVLISKKKQVFHKNGQCTITIADEILKGNWTLEGNRLHIKIISKSDRYDSLDNSFRLKILEDPNYDFEAQLIEVWESDYLGGQVLIHLLYGQGNSPEDHAWFMARRNASGNWSFIGGSTFPNLM